MASPLSEQLLDQERQKGYVCRVGDYCSAQMRTPTVPGSDGGIYHRTTTTIKDGKATTDVYIISDGKRWVKAATTTDGGKTYTFSEATRPNGTKVAGDGLRQSLTGDGDMNKNVKKQINDTLKSGGVQESATTPKLTDTQIKETGAVSTNTASSNATTEGDQEGGNTASEDKSTPITPEQLKELVKGRDDTRSIKAYENLRYPLSITAPGNTQDVVQFTIMEYIPKKFNTDIANQLKSGIAEPSLLSKSTEAGSEAVTGGTVTLPIQPSISDSNAVDWQESSLNPFQAAIGSLANSLISGTIGENNQNPTQNNDNKDGLNSLGQFALSYFSQGAAGGEGDIFTRTTGAVLNPNLELLFRGPSLRGFNFSFTMSAREPAEAIQIKKIIRFFKQGMSVKRAKSALFLKSPHIFKIKYVYRGGGKTEIHPWLNTFKECALTNCTVNYTPAGNYSTFADGAMTQYDLNLAFTELEPIYDDDYATLPGGNTDTHIGY
jgi:hypothetical protein